MSSDNISPKTANAPTKNTSAAGTEINIKRTGSIIHIGTNTLTSKKSLVANSQIVKLLTINISPIVDCFKGIDLQLP